jgi:modulator of FtsH protease HflK
MAEHEHPKDELNRPAAAPPETPLDAGSQALSEALRSSFGIIKVVMVLLLLVFLASGFFTVGPQERAIIIRLGRPVGEGEKALLGPGPHWSWPYPIDEYVKVPITSVQKVRSTVGWYFTTPEAEQAGNDYPALPVTTPINSLVDGYVLTADKNIVHTRATLTYHIERPIDFVFNFVNASNMVQSALDNALLAVASGYNVDDILTRDVAGFKDALRKRVIEHVKNQELGIAVEECLVESRAPRQLIDAFRSVVEAEVKRGTVVSEARGYETRVVSKATADAQSRINAAETERSTLVTDLNGQAERFKEVLPKYRQNPALFTDQRLTESLATVLTNAQEKIFLTWGDKGKPTELRLLLNREPPKKTEEPKTQ